MEWLDERWCGNRYFHSCHVCVPPRRHPGCHANCKDYDNDKAVYEKVKKSMAREKEVDACIKASNNRIKRYYDVDRKETVSEDNS